MKKKLDFKDLTPLLWFDDEGYSTVGIYMAREHEVRLLDGEDYELEMTEHYEQLSEPYPTPIVNLIARIEKKTRSLGRPNRAGS